jgi:hypothetical protein
MYYDQGLPKNVRINPVVALNLALRFIQPLSIGDAAKINIIRWITQLVTFKIDDENAGKNSFFNTIQLIQSYVYATIGLTCPKRLDDIHLRGSDRRQHASNKTHDQGKPKALPNNIKGEGEAKGELGESLEIHRGNREKL